MATAIFYSDKVFNVFTHAILQKRLYSAVLLGSCIFQHLSSTASISKRFQLKASGWAHILRIFKLFPDLVDVLKLDPAELA
jgi:hypothetical protein